MFYLLLSAPVKEFCQAAQLPLRNRFPAMHFVIGYA